jgi:formylglycine-generating enzyme required for sulfatase activity
MKNKILIALSLVIGVVAFSAMSSRSGKKLRKNVKHGLFSKNMTDHFLGLNDSVLVYNYEVTNYQYQVFLDDIKQDQPELHEQVKPDASLWESSTSKPYGTSSAAEHYHSHPAYDAYPVVNIPKEGAVAFCNWMTAKDGNLYHSFRLPTEAEWMEASGVMPGHNLPWKNSMPFNAEGIYYANLKYYSVAEQKLDYVWDGRALPTTPGSYEPSPGGVYDMIGNVAEMVGDRELIKGGSWDHELKESTVELSEPYTGPDPRVGFRIVMAYQMPSFESN